jgi:hypothetical protein
MQVEYSEIPLLGALKGVVIPPKDRIAVLNNADAVGAIP